MRLLVVTHYYASHRGGIEIVAGELCRALIDAGHSVEWVASDATEVPEAREGLNCLPMLSFNGIERWLGLPFPLWSPASVVRLWRACARADVVHLHDFIYPGNMAAYICARLNGLPVVVTQHVGFIPYRSSLARLLLWLLQGAVGRWILGGADQTIFISQEVLRYFRDTLRLKFQRPPELIPNGVDTALYQYADPEQRAGARRGEGLPVGEAILLFVGRFVEKKGLNRLESMARSMPDVLWIFVGWGPEDPERWGLRNVRVLRDRNGAGVVPLYQAADLLVLPSVGEGFPLVVQEAMSCGTPAMVSADTARALPAVGALLIRERVEPGCEEQWVDRIRKFLASRDEMEDRRRQCADFARSNWSWGRCAASYAKATERFGATRPCAPRDARER